PSPSPLVPYTTLFRSRSWEGCRLTPRAASQARPRETEEQNRRTATHRITTYGGGRNDSAFARENGKRSGACLRSVARRASRWGEDRKSTRLNSSHVKI